MAEEPKEDSFLLKIRRGWPQQQYWEEFILRREPGKNVISALMEIQRHPINREGQRVAPVVWEQGCLEEVCGSCSMLINGRPRQACTALIEKLIEESGSTTIVLAPFSKFPLVRDLIVDRDQMFENLKKIHGWIDVENSLERGFGPRISQQKQEVMYQLSSCMTCGCCVEACPQSNRRSKFVGPQIIAQVKLFNDNPTGRMMRGKRLEPLMGEGGLAECGNAQNCVEVCPKKIPLTNAIGAVGRDLTFYAFRKLFGLTDQE